MNSTIIDPSDLALFGPSNEPDSICRDSLVSTLLRFGLDKNIRYVVTKGEEGSGKTTTLSQFVLDNKKNCLCLFLGDRNISQIHGETIYRDLYEQISAYLNEVTGDKPIDRKQISTKIQTLLYRLKKKNESIFLVLDGIDECWDTDNYVVQQLLEILTFFACPEITIYITTNRKEIISTLNIDSTQFFSMIDFSNDEFKKIIPDLTEEDIDYFSENISRKPSDIRQFKRLKNSGMTTNEIFEKFSQENGNLLAAEWDNNLSKISGFEELFAVITFSDNIVSTEFLCREFGYSAEELISFFQNISIIECNNKEVRLVTSAVRKYAREKLVSYKNEAITLIIGSLKKEGGLNSLLLLPSYYMQAGKKKSLIAHLSSENLLSVLEHGNSFSDISKLIDMGKKVSKEVESEEDLLRFSHLQGISMGVSRTSSLESELMSYLTEEDIKGAIDFASSADSNEARITLFTKVAKHQQSKGMDIDPSLNQQIEELYKTINPKFMKIEDVVDLASDLFAIMPKKAIELFSQADEHGISGQNRSDYAFLKFALATAKGKDANLELLESNTDAFSEKRQVFIESMRVFRPGTPANKIIKMLGGEGNAGSNILFLQQWIKSFPNTPNVEVLVDHAMELTIATTDFTAGAEFYADLLIGLEYSNNSAMSKNIVDAIISQLDILKALSPTVSYVDLLLSLTRYEYKTECSISRIKQIHHFINNEINDKSVRLNAYCRLHQEILSNEYDYDYVDIVAVKNLLVTDIIDKTADHYEVLKYALKVEAKINLENADAWVDRLNIVSRRDLGRKAIVESACSFGNNLSVSRLYKVIKKIINTAPREHSIKKLLRYCEKSNQLKDSDFQRLRKLKNSLMSTRQRVDALVSLIKIDNKWEFLSDEVSKNLKEQLSIEWGKIDSDWEKIDLGFQIHNNLYVIDKPYSIEIKKKTIDLRSTCAIDCAQVAGSIIHSIDLAIRAFSFLIPHHLSSKSEQQRLINLIDQIPCKKTRSRLLSRLISVFQKSMHEDRGDSIIETKLLPLLEAAITEEDNFIACFYWAGPIFANYNFDSFLQHLNLINDDLSAYDLILHFCADYTLSDCILGDPFDPLEKQVPKLSYDQVNIILQIMRKLDEDSRIYFIMTQLVSSLVEGKRKHRYTKVQLNAFKVEIEKIVRNNFQKNIYIQHEGYKICGEGLLLKLSGGKNEKAWDSLLHRAKEITNSSDSAFTLTLLSEMIPPSSKIKAQAIAASHNELEKIPSDLDKLLRYESLAKSSKDTNILLAKIYVEKAIRVSTSNETDEYERRRSSIIDIAHSIDPEFSKNLAAVSDDDPAKKKLIQKSITQRIEKKNTQDKFKMGDDQIANGALSENYANTAWKLLGKVNAENYPSERKPQYIDFLNNVSLYSPSALYAMLSFYVASVGVKFGDKVGAQKHLKPIFDTLLSNSNLLIAIFSERTRLPPVEKYSVNPASIHIEKGGFDKAAKFTAGWLEGMENNQLIIIDPYFELNDLKFIGDSIKKDPNYRITLLTSYKNLATLAENFDEIESTVCRFWKENISDIGMPQIELIFAGLPSLKLSLPIHDRWWITEDGGLQFGGSLNGIGGERLTSITILNYSQVVAIEQKVKGFIDTKKQKEYNNEKIKYAIIPI